LLGNVRLFDFKNPVNGSLNVFEGMSTEEILSMPPLLLGRRRRTDLFESARELSPLESFRNTSPTPRWVSGSYDVPEA